MVEEGGFGLFHVLLEVARGLPIFSDTYDWYSVSVVIGCFSKDKLQRCIWFWKMSESQLTH